MDKNIEKTVRAVIDDLRRKIEQINLEADKCGAPVKEEAFRIRDKAVNALNGVIAKVGRSISIQEDPEEVYRSLSTVIEKSKTLYNNAIGKIRKLNGTKKVAKPATFTDDIESGMENIFDGVEGAGGFVGETSPKEIYNISELSADSMDTQAVSILKSWLSPHGEKI